MKNFEIKKSLIIFKSNFKLRFKSTLIWAIIMVSAIFLYMFMFPLVKEMIEDELSLMPPELLALFGMSQMADMGNYTSYFALVYQIIFIALACYCVSLGGNIIVEEEANKTIDYLYSQEVSRTEIYIGKLLATLANIIIIVFSSYCACLIAGFSVGKDTMNIGGITMIFIITTISLLFFNSMSLLISIIFPRSIKSSSIGMGILFGTYIIGYLGDIIQKIDFLKFFSPIHICSCAPIADSTLGIGTEKYNFIPVIIILLLIIIFLIVSPFFYKKKDL